MVVHPAEWQFNQSIEYVNDVIEVLVLGAALEKKYDNLKHQCTCKVQKKRCSPIKKGQHFSITSILGNSENEIFKIPSSATKVFECNHEEGETRIIFHVLQQKTNVAVYLKDADVLVLVVFAYALNKINEKQVMKIESRKNQVLRILQSISRN